MYPLETSKIAKCVNPSKVWLRYVDGIFVIIKRNFFDETFINKNNISESIKVTKKIESNNHKLAFLDCLIERRYNNQLKFSVFRESTHYEKYLDYSSTHACCTKFTIIKKLYNRSLNLITEKEDQQTEFDAILSTHGANNHRRSF